MINQQKNIFILVTLFSVIAIYATAFLAFHPTNARTFITGYTKDRIAYEVEIFHNESVDGEATNDDACMKTMVTTNMVNVYVKDLLSPHVNEIKIIAEDIETTCNIEVSSIKTTIFTPDRSGGSLTQELTFTP